MAKDSKKLVGYCLKCKKKVLIKNPRKVVVKNHPFIKGECPICGTTVWRVISKKK